MTSNIPTTVGAKTCLVLSREIYSSESIIGHIFFDPLIKRGLVEKPGKPKAYTSLELAWRGNKRSVSCIPPGIYPLKYKTYGRFYNRYKERFEHQFVPLVCNVPGRSEILFHIGNYPKDTLGCVLVGEYAGIDNPDFIKNSTTAYKKFYKEISKKKPQYLVVEQA